MLKRALKIVLAVVLVLAAAAGGFLVWLTVTEYRPEDVEAVAVTQSAGGADAETADTLTVLTWNTGYSGLGADADFVMDGGKSNGRPKSADIVRGNASGITKALLASDADIYLLQEVDSHSARSYFTDQTAGYLEGLAAASGTTLYGTYALNYSCKYVPFPFPPIGQVQSGVETITGLPVESALRVALPCPFSWPLRVANLKRCLLVSYIALPDTEAQLAVVNLHLEAYDSGEGKAAQTGMLYDFIEAEYEKGNYVLCGGDFNQTVPGALESWPVLSEDYWTPGILDTGSLPEGWTFSCDAATPTCRSLDRPYDPEDENFQYYVIDGFIVSPNVEALSVKTLDMGFKNTDHNPVQLEIRLK